MPDSCALIVSSNGADQNGSSAQAAPFDPLSREFLLGQLKGEGWTIALIFVALFFCTACTTVTPLLSSAFFESLLGRLPADQFYKVGRPAHNGRLFVPPAAAKRRRIAPPALS